MRFDLQRFPAEKPGDDYPKASYTLADGSTVTVSATEQGIPFNEGMQALTKAIKARVSVRDGSGSGGVQSPNLRFEGHRITWEGSGECILYDGHYMISIRKDYNEPMSPGYFVLTSDGTYAKDWLSFDDDVVTEHSG